MTPRQPDENKTGERGKLLVPIGEWTYDRETQAHAFQWQWPHAFFIAPDPAFERELAALLQGIEAAWRSLRSRALELQVEKELNADE